MKLTKLARYSLLVLIMGSYDQCAPEDWDYRSREYVVRKNLESKIPLSGTSGRTQVLTITPAQIRSTLGLNEQLDSEWLGEKMTYTLKAVKVEGCAVDINLLANNQASTLNLEGTVTVAGRSGNVPLFNTGTVQIPLNEIALILLTAKLNRNAVTDVQQVLSDNLNNLNKALTISFKGTTDPSNKAASAEALVTLGITATYDVCQLMPPGSGGMKCK
ncbi:hypothetical protein GCM10023187_15770 [Nibrella viscosa]|uniref:Uncharacterized protein n=1 Tax=Nibrella viscosa TaxID=1084524 RepID=A0ABP8K7D9_9BACT